MIRSVSAIAALGLMVAACGAPAGNESARREEAEQAAKRIYAEVPAGNEQTALAEQGRKMYRTAGCESCHSTRHERMGLQGPPLGGVAARVMARGSDELESRRWLVKHIKSPQLYPSPYKDDEAYTGAVMTPYNQFRDEDMRALVEFLWSLG